MNELNNVYEAPEVLDLGNAAELTLGKNFGDWPDGLDNKLIWAY